MTTKQKAKAYDEAWHKAKRIINVCVDDNTECRSMIACIQQIFPELAESEDERIRKALICGMYALKEQHKTCFASIPIDNAIAWLEKQSEKKSSDEVLKIRQEVYQSGYNDGYKHGCEDTKKKGEQKPTDEEMKTLLRTEYEKGRADAIAEMQNPVDCIDCTNSKGCINCEDGNMKETLVQKTAWSEEDECYMSECIGAIATKDGWSFEEKRKTKHWLKSLKDRVQPRRRHTIFDEII